MSLWINALELSHVVSDLALELCHVDPEPDMSVLSPDMSVLSSETSVLSSETSDLRVETSDFNTDTSDFRSDTSDFRFVTSDLRIVIVRVHVADVGAHLGDVLEGFDETFVECGWLGRHRFSDRAIWTLMPIGALCPATGARQQRRFLRTCACDFVRLLRLSKRCLPMQAYPKWAVWSIPGSERLAPAHNGDRGVAQKSRGFA